MEQRQSKEMRRPEAVPAIVFPEQSLEGVEPLFIVGQVAAQVGSDQGLESAGLLGASVAGRKHPAKLEIGSKSQRQRNAFVKVESAALEIHLRRSKDEAAAREQPFLKGPGARVPFGRCDLEIGPRQSCRV